MMRALITGITGQDGSYLAESLLANGYEVHGVLRRSSSFGTGRIDHIFERLTLHYGDATDGANMLRIVRDVMPHELYNLAAQSHVRVSFDTPLYTAQATGIGQLAVLEAVRDVEATTGHRIRLYQASSSEMFGKVAETPQSETTPFHPRSPYAVAKVYAHWATVNYREAYGLHASCGILFNHESPRRGETFVTRKITRAATRIKCGLQSTLALGNLSAVRDWGYAGDYVHAMWLMLQQDEPGDYVIATGECHTVGEFCAAVFDRLGLHWRDYVRHDPRLERPAEVDLLLGDASRARGKLGWEPRVSFDALVGMMVDADLRLARQEAAAAAVA